MYSDPAHATHVTIVHYHTLLHYHIYKQNILFCYYFCQKYLDFINCTGQSSNTITNLNLSLLLYLLETTFLLKKKPIYYCFYCFNDNLNTYFDI